MNPKITVSLHFMAIFFHCDALQVLFGLTSYEGLFLIDVKILLENLLSLGVSLCHTGNHRESECS